MKLQDIFEAEEPKKLGRKPGGKNRPKEEIEAEKAAKAARPPRVAKTPTIVPPYDENGLSNTRWSLDHNAGSPLHSIRSNTKLGKQYREEHKALEDQVNYRIREAMRPYFEQHGYESRLSPAHPGRFPLGPGCYLEVDESHKYKLGKGYRELLDAMSQITGVRGTHRNFPNIDEQLYIYKFQVDGPNGIKLPAIAELYIVFEEARTPRKGEATPERWAVWLPRIIVGDELSISGKTPEAPRAFG